MLEDEFMILIYSSSPKIFNYIRNTFHNFYKINSNDPIVQPKKVQQRVQKLQTTQEAIQNQAMEMDQNRNVNSSQA